MIFGSSTNQRRATDVDLLNGFLPGHAGLGHSLFEWVEVYDNQVDRLHARLCQNSHILSQLTTRQNAPMDLRMESLDPPAQNLRLSGIG